MDLVQYESWVISELKSVQANPNCAMPELDLRALLAENFSIGQDRAYRLIREVVKHNRQVVLEKWGKEFAVIYR